MESIWTKEITTKPEESLKKDLVCDILIIGGGIAGMHAAFYLKDARYKTVLIDKKTIGSGITSRTTAKITYMQGSIYSNIEKMYDFKTAKKYLNSQIDACEMLEKNIKDYHISCNYEKSPSYLFTTKDNKLKKEIDFFKKANIPIIDSKNLPIKFPCKSSIKTDAAIFHPLKYLNALKNIILTSKIKIYENTIATNITRENNYYIVRTQTNMIKAKKVIICTNYPFFIIPGLIPLKLYVEKSYIICGKSDNKKFNAINIDKDIYSIRYYKDNIIFAGLSESLTNKENNNREKLEKVYKKYFDNNIILEYENQDVMTHDYMPLIGKINGNSNLLIATGFNKWGMTNGLLAGKIISDIILNNPNKYIELFSPNRKMSIPKLINSLIQNTKIVCTFISGKLINQNSKKLYRKNIKGNKCNIYIENKQKHIVNRICPHMGCTLKLNSKEKTWDCKCHGSKFDIEGNLINGPSVYDIKIE